MLFHLAAVASYLAVASAATLTYNWNITWTLANPDGQYERLVPSINGQWPLPLLNFTKGDRVVANVYNALGNESTSIHFHGFFQHGTNNMDGPPLVTQCEIPPGSSYTYNFTVRERVTIRRNKLNSARWNKLEPTGIIHILVVNIQMVYAKLLQ